MERLLALSEDYEADFVQWLERQIGLLRERQLSRLDVDNLIQELEELVSNHKRELRSRLKVIILHLLKWEHQERLRSASWRQTLEVQRQEVELLLRQSPSLSNHVLPFARDEYRRAVRLAVGETSLPAHAFPADLPYSREQLLDPDFVP